MLCFQYKFDKIILTRLLQRSAKSGRPLKSMVGLAYNIGGIPATPPLIIFAIDKPPLFC